MFEHRLGLALGMTIGQIKAWMTDAEYRSWMTYYKVEPFGWQDREYRTAALMMMLNNTSISKRSDARKTSYFMRDPEKTISEQVNQADKREQLLAASKEDRAVMIATAFGGMGIRTKVTNGNGSNDSG